MIKIYMRRSEVIAAGAIPYPNPKIRHTNEKVRLCLVLI